MSSAQITFRELTHFLAVISEGGFVRASQALNISQPSISQSVQNLEAKIGASLIVRGRKSIQLTEKGQIFRRYAERTVNDEISLRERLSETRETVEGPLRVAVPPAIASICFPAIIDVFCRRYPDVMLEIDECPSDRLIPRLRSGKTEIAALILPAAERDLRLYPLGRDHLSLVVPSQHPLAEAHHCRLDDILDERIVLLREDFKINDFIMSAFASHSAQPHVTGRTSDIHLLMAMVRAGVGLGIVPSLLCRDSRMTGLTALKLLSPSISFDLVMATRKDHTLSKAGEAWRRVCQAHFIEPDTATES
ncbi:LysR family transcriptional regulator [Asaia bogorensis]|uniref:LysR family transcriptional regulator n=1 Tax=Asaia bogorensis TaxID=91915 RepID=UPI0013CF3532|nr:LysR family transcriptional regulator [Asaia bogorensis]